MNESLRKEIFVWMNKNPDKIKEMTIKDIADVFFTSPPTVTKALQSFGYKGYKEFKQVVFADLFNDGEQRYTVANSISNSISKALNDNDFIDQMQNLNEEILNSNDIYIIGKGHSNLIGQYLQRQIIYSFNKRCQKIDDNYHFLSINKNSLLIAISLDLTSSQINQLENKINCKKILITKIKPKWKKVHIDNYDNVIRIPFDKTAQENYDNPIISKSIIEIAISIFLKNNQKGDKHAANS